MPPDDKPAPKADDKPAAPDYAKEIADLKAQNAAVLEQLASLKGNTKHKKDETQDDDDSDLSDKVRKKRESDEKTQGDSKALESALKFSLKSDEFVKTNASLLPKDVADIFNMAEKENYNNAIEKANAIKDGIVQSFFREQANMDLLTAGQKIKLEDYLKMTKTGRAEKVQEMYDSIFEPAFEMLRRVKKAEALQKGFGESSGTEEAYKKRLMGLSKKHYLGEKENGT